MIEQGALQMLKITGRPCVVVGWVKFYKKCPRHLSPATGLSSTQCSHQWSGDRVHPYLGWLQGLTVIIYVKLPLQTVAHSGH